MVGMKKFSITAAASAVMAVTGAAASLQPADASHAHHVISHRSLAERQQQPGMIKMQKRLGLNIIGDGLGGLVSGIGNDLGLGDDQAGHGLLRRGLVGDVLGAGGQGGSPPSTSSSSSSSSSAPAPQTSSAAPSSSSSSNNNNSGGSSSSPASASQTSAATPATQQSAASSNQNRPATSSASSSGSNQASSNNNQNNNSSSSSNNNQNSNSNNNNSNNNNNNNNSSNNNNNSNTANRAASIAASTSVSSIAAAASASASAAAASLLSSASISQASAEAAASAAAATLAGSSSSSSVTSTPTGANRANSSSGSKGNGGTTKVVVPIVVIAASLAIIAVLWTLIRRYRKNKAEQYEPSMAPIERSYHHRSMMGGAGGLTAGAAAFAVGGAASGLVRDRPRRDSYESYRAGRPMSALTEEEGEFSGVSPPMQEVTAYSAVGSANAPTSSRLRNYGNGEARLTDSMYVDRNTRHDVEPHYLSGNTGAVTPFSDEYGAYDVNYYDGSSNVGYNNRATRGIDAAGASSAGGRPYSPYADVQRGNSSGDDEAGYYDYDRASSSRRGGDPFVDTGRWSS
ncbi:uncharacterized protein MEPE_02840 [Melanopsichium pennsylvanicum]|uniref:Uncharacterized protein n=1 Tax=Melanopsichium pennsylvanicum TaxID=63383 RepID=A0AAJ4XLN6_9BASI|nr:uncharacterized protein MEPE_02840 [Melanopsichium pennsylvanicum]